MEIETYEKIIDEAYDNAARISAKLESGASDYFKDKLTLTIFERILPPMGELYKDTLEELLNKLPPSIKYKNDFGELKISNFYDTSKKWSVEYTFSSTSSVRPITYWDESLSKACEKMLAFLEGNNLIAECWKGKIC